MAIPTFQAVMRPLLELAADGTEHQTSAALAEIGDRFHLTQEEREELLPSGQQRRFNNRIAWATAYLRATGLFESAGRGRFRITERGRKALDSGQTIDLKYLAQYPELAVFRSGPATPGDADKQPPAEAASATPDELLDATALGLRKQLVADLLDKVRAVDPFFFEKLVLDLLVAMGYGGSRAEAARRTQRSGDEGIDGIINEDKLGLDVVCIQAKRWGKTVGRPDVQMFSGSLDGKSSKGVFITTSSFTADAREYARTSTSKKLILIDGDQLAQLMIDNNVGVNTVATYVTKRIDSDYFDVE